MEIFEIDNLNCSDKNNRISLVKETMKVLKLEEKPTEKQLNDACKKLLKRYGYTIKRFRQENNRLFVSIKVGTAYHTFTCKSTYELMCKYILFVKAQINYKRLEPN